MTNHIENRFYRKMQQVILLLLVSVFICTQTLGNLFISDNFPVTNQATKKEQSLEGQTYRTMQFAVLTKEVAEDQEQNKTESKKLLACVAISLLCCLIAPRLHSLEEHLNKYKLFRKRFIPLFLSHQAWKICPY